MKDEGRHFLQFVPVKEPRADTFTVLANDKEIAGFDESKFVFTDVTFDATDQVYSVFRLFSCHLYHIALPQGFLCNKSGFEHTMIPGIEVHHLWRSSSIFCICRTYTIERVQKKSSSEPPQSALRWIEAAMPNCLFVGNDN